MNLLEEELLERAFEGQEEDKLLATGETVKVRKYDNKLAFDLLRFNHEHYVKTAARSGGKQGEGKDTGGMTLILAGQSGHSGGRAVPGALTEGRYGKRS